MPTVSFTPNTANNSVIRQATDTWANIRAATDGTDIETSSAIAHYIANSSNGGGSFSIRRYFFYFDLTSIAAGSVVNHSNPPVLALKSATDFVASGDSDGLTLVSATPADKNSI